MPRLYCILFTSLQHTHCNIQLKKEGEPKLALFLCYD